MESLLNKKLRNNINKETTSNSNKQEIRIINKQPNKTIKKETDLISVIIPTYNVINIYLMLFNL